MMYMCQFGQNMVIGSRPYFHPYLVNWHFAFYLSVHEKRGACLIGYLCTSFLLCLFGLTRFIFG